jgi:hypothetical protein
VIATRVIVITPRDNVATALEALAPGETIEANGLRVTVRDAIASGHKVALSAIGSGSAVVKYGNTIGRATTDIEAGAHVHIHNVSSERGRGDKTRI